MTLTAKNRDRLLPKIRTKKTRKVVTAPWKIAGPIWYIVLLARSTTEGFYCQDRYFIPLGNELTAFFLQRGQTLWIPVWFSVNYASFK